MQIIVYAGAIMVLFLFVIMLLGVDGREDLRERRLIAQRPVAIALGVAFVLEVIVRDPRVDRLLGATRRPGSTR